MNILHISASPRTATSHSARLGTAIVERLLALHPRSRVQLRDLAAEPLPHVDGHFADALAGLAPDGPSSGTVACSDRLIAELEQADTIVLATPMHNFTVPSSLKAWIDHVLRIHRTFTPTAEGKRGLLRDRPVYLAVASGGLFHDQDARQPDFLTPYLRAVLDTMGLRQQMYLLLQGMVRGPQAADAQWQAARRRLDDLLPLPTTALAA